MNISLWTKIRLWFVKPDYCWDFGDDMTVVQTFKRLNGVTYVLKEDRLPGIKK